MVRKPPLGTNMITPVRRVEVEVAGTQPGRGHVYLIGAGPGDPELLTLKARRLIGEADVVIYAGSLVNPAVLGYARPGAEIHDSARLKLEEQIEIMARATGQGKLVARLHTGDPTLYGAIMEQMQALARLGVPYTIVPGVSSVFAAGAALGIEYTLPGDTQSLILSRLAGRTAVPSGEALRDLARHHSSLVLYLSAGLIGEVVAELYAAGYTTDTPVAIVQRASWPDELILRGTLATIVAQAQAAEITHQALIVISPALAQARQGGWPRSHLYGAAMDAPESQDSLAIVTLTRQGLETGKRLWPALPGSVLYGPAPLMEGVEPSGRLVAYTQSVRQVLQEAFGKHRGLVCIMACGIVVRDLAPVLRSKLADPGVVVVDEGGRYALSLLSGHLGGGNRLAQEVAGILGGQAVITTASDVQGLPALDLLGQAWGWSIDPGAHLTAASAALVNGDPVGVFQEAGNETWWPSPAPAHLTRYTTLAGLVLARPAAALVISYRYLPPEAAGLPGLVVYRPPCLAVGIGCNRGTQANEIEAAVETTLAAAGLSTASVASLASIEDKADEPGLRETAGRRGWPLAFFSRARIASAGHAAQPFAVGRSRPRGARRCRAGRHAGGRPRHAARSQAEAR